MQETSSLYKEILSGEHWKEYRLAIGERGKLITEQNEAILFGSAAYDSIANGSVIQLEETTNTPLKGLKVFGKTIQNGTPTPDAPIALETVGDDGNIAVTVSGKNLLNYDVWKNVAITNGTAVFENNGVTLTAASDDCFTNYSANFYKIPVTEGETITLSWESDVNGDGICYIFPNGNTNGLVYVNNKTAKKLTYAVKSGVAFVTFRMGVRIKGSTISYKNVQIERGSVATAYEPYKGIQTLSVSTPNGLPGIPVTSGGNYTDESGQQWICDEVDFEKGVYVRRIGVVDFTNSNTSVLSRGTIGTGNKYRFIIANNSESVSSASVTKNLLCTVARAGNENETWLGINCVCYTKSGSILIYLDEISSMTVAEATAWLRERSVKVQYILATPTETALSAEQLAAFSALHTNDLNTTIYNDSGAFMEATYVMNGAGSVRILIGSSGADNGYAEDIIVSMNTYVGMFPEDLPVVGECIAGEISATILKPKGDIQRMSRIVPYVRICNSEKQSEWIQKGVFFIDHRSYSGEDNELMEIHGYDAMLLGEADFPSSEAEWPRKDIDVVRDIATEMDVTVDDRTVAIMNKGYMVQYPAEYSQREVLGFLAAMYAGSFVMSDTGELRLVQMNGIPKETSYLADHAGFILVFGGEKILV